MLLEINCKELNLDKYCLLFKKEKVLGCTITCKRNSKNLQDIIDMCFAMGFQTVVPTFSISVEYDKTLERTIEAFKKFELLLIKNGISQGFIVTGNPRKKLTTLDCFQILYKNKTKLNWSTAYNPFAEDMKEENNRLKLKLKFDFTTEVYLQLGEDPAKMVKGVEYIRKLRKDIKIIGSVLYPTTKILNALTFRPIYGVFYSQKFLNDMDYAKQQMQNYQKILKEQNCEILLSSL